ncbi:MAG TPA: TIGR02281 family clan AA aspartic protease [Stellaceae bacterium]|jgi:aspartyl protease family protein|nr:TIGR02281 family clan AA aspartic protease [Stellaceae bacterium]
MVLRSRSQTRRVAGAMIVGLALAASPSLAASPDSCQTGVKVTDDLGRPGQILGGQDGLCLVKYPDGRTQAWLPLNSLATAPAAGKPAAAPLTGVAVLRPTGIERSQFRSDALGHFMIDASVNDAPVKFLLDTGATLVALTPADAAAADINSADLKFDHTVQTGNGPAQAAPTHLRHLSIGEHQIDDVDAVVIKNLKQSVLGMSFLRRLKDFSIRDGTLTMEW